MKNKRLLRIFAMVLSVVTLTGCGNMPDVTERENDLIAEYAAGVLLRYSEDYELRLMSEEQAKESEEEQMMSATPSPTPLMTSSPTPTSTKQPEIQVEVVSGGAVDVIQEETLQEVSLNELYQLSNIDVKYVKKEFAKGYTEPGVLIKAEDGRTKLIITFTLKNTSSAKKEVNLTNRKISYLLSVDGLEIAPEFSLLRNGGLNHFSATLKPGQSEKVLLIFDLAEERKNTSQLMLEIVEGEKQVTLDLLK